MPGPNLGQPPRPHPRPQSHDPVEPRVEPPESPKRPSFGDPGR